MAGGRWLRAQVFSIFLWLRRKPVDEATSKLINWLFFRRHEPITFLGFWLRLRLLEVKPRL